VTFCVPGNRICWNVIIQLGITEVADEQFKTSDWVPQQNKKMMDSIRDFKTPYGILGDLFDATPLDRVSKVYFEDMLFDTWNNGRTILIGDGKHTFFSSPRMPFFLDVVCTMLTLDIFIVLFLPLFHSRTQG
jgi:hypothetical protein